MELSIDGNLWLSSTHEHSAGNDGNEQIVNVVLARCVVTVLRRAAFADLHG